MAVQQQAARPDPRIVFVIDRSGSMNKIASDVIGGFNQFIQDQRKLPEQALVTYTQFDTVYEVIYRDKPISEVPDLNSETFKPRGGTALWDAIGTTLTNMPIGSIGVTLVVMTDGEDTSSFMFTTERVKSLVRDFEGGGNQIMFLGANIDSFTMSNNIGINAAAVTNFAADAAGAAASFSAVSSKLMSTRSAYSKGVSDWADAGGTLEAAYTRSISEQAPTSMNAEKNLQNKINQQLSEAKSDTSLKSVQDVINDMLNDGESS